MRSIQYATVSPGDIKNEYIRRFVVQTANLMKLEAMQALLNFKDPAKFPVKHVPITCGGIPKQYRSIGKVVAERLKSKPANKQAQIRQQTLSSAVLTTDIKALAKQLNIDFTSGKYVIKQADLESYFSFINPSYADSLTAHLSDLVDQFLSDAYKSISNKSLHFRLHYVKCVDKTDPEWIGGKDEIAMGAVSSEENGYVKKSHESKVGKFDDGDVKKFDPVKVIANFPLNEKYPKTFFVYVALAEKDAGKFGDFLSDLYEAVRAEVVYILQSLGSAAGTAIGAAIGASTGSAVAPPIGTIIGVLVGLILGMLVGWFVSSLKDDIFEPQMATITLNTATALFVEDSRISPTMDLIFHDHGATYKVWYSWALIQ